MSWGTVFAGDLDTLGNALGKKLYIQQEGRKYRVVEGENAGSMRYLTDFLPSSQMFNIIGGMRIAVKLHPATTQAEINAELLAAAEAVLAEVECFCADYVADYGPCPVHRLQEAVDKAKGAV